MLLNLIEEIGIKAALDSYREANKEIDLSYADFSEENLEGIDFSNANLTHALFINADLENANLHNANLTHACMTAARLIRANLTGANLQNTRLNGSDLRGANLTGANIEYTNLTESILYLTQGIPQTKQKQIIVELEECWKDEPGGYSPIED